MPRSRRGSGFTLIELLIVVAIIAVLAAIAVPNFMHAQIRAKIAATRGDFHNLATVFEAYCADWQTYPMGAATNPFGYDLLAVFSTPVSYTADPFTMTLERFHTDIAYTIAQIRYDIMFGRNDHIGFSGSNRTQAFKPIPRDSWIITSFGPDGRDDVLDTPMYPSYPNVFIVYDPSNGLVSRGDLFRIGGGYMPWWIVPYLQQQ